jgi:hypothetical protein
MGLELTHCPACGWPAEVFDRFVVFGERGPMEHVKIRCITGRDYELRVGRWNPTRGWRPAPGPHDDGGWGFTPGG